MLTAQEVMDQAQQATGLAGLADEGFVARLETTLDAISRVPLTGKAREEFDAKVVSDTASRLKVEDYVAHHPEILETPVEQPVLITGMPRTGTTATVAMMALDPRYRFMRIWEAGAPVPPPRLEDEPNDPRAVAARKAISDLPQSLHLSDPDGPEEDLSFMSGLDMRNYLGRYPMPDDYIEWWIEQDFSDFYAFHSKILQILHSQRPPNQWLLKAPPHLFRLEEFLGQYPDAKFVITHRDPASVIASDASLRWQLNCSVCEPDSLQPKESCGPRLLAFWERGIKKMIAARERIGEDRFVDVRNSDVIEDPLGTFERLYNELGFAMPDDLHEAISAYLETNSQGAHGSHSYKAEDFGLSRDMVRERLGAYCERFGV